MSDARDVDVPEDLRWRRDLAGAPGGPDEPEAADDLEATDDLEAADDLEGDFGVEAPVEERPDSSFWSQGPPVRERRRGRVLAPFLAALLGAGAGTGVTFVALDRGEPEGGVSRVVSPVVPSSTQPADPVAAVARAVTPSIVRIDTVGPGRFGKGTGSGVIYRTDGYIVTNDHVVAGASDIEVILPDGDRLDAQLVGTAAPVVDIAVIKVSRPGLAAATLGSTRDAHVGDLAVAIGSPFGLQGTVTAGVISALHRNITARPDVRFTDAIQTDAPINPGNSGGALANGRGEVIGINTAIIGGDGGGSVGVGFAIPIEIARRVADQIIATGRASLPFLGISGQNLPDDRGALIQEVLPGGPAEGAGLRPRDVIVELDGQPVRSMDELIALLIQKDVGASVRSGYLRDRERRTAQARLAARPGGS